VKARSDELQIFVSVIECGSISAAAEQVGQTPSAVSRTLSRLEGKLDTTLINRTTRRMDLTEEGKFFFERAKQILEQMDDLEERLSLRQQTPAGRLRINAASPFMLHAVVPYIDEFRRLYPDIQLELNSNDLIIDLLEQSTDIAIRIGTLADSTLHARSLGSSPLNILASPAYLEQRGTPTTVAQLAEHSLIGFTQTESLNHWPLRHAQGDRWQIQPSLSANSGYRQPIHAVYYRNSQLALRIQCFLDFIQSKLSRYAL
jgi:DNA-binding transcriptional LysR family regulator